MSVLFNNIPNSGWFVPFFYAEFNAGGSAYEDVQSNLIIAQKLPTGTAPAGEPIIMPVGVEDGYFGVGSMAARMVKIARLNAPQAELHVLPLDDDPAGVKATGTIKIALPAGRTVAQVLAVRVAGVKARIAVQPADTNDIAATNLSAAIAAIGGLPVSSSAAADTITLEALNAGTIGNHIAIELPDIADGPLSAQALTITPMANGAGDPDVASAIANLGDTPYEWVSNPYSDDTNVANLGAFLDDLSGRWSWMQQLYGHSLSTRFGDFPDQIAWFDARNDRHHCIMPVHNSPTGPEIWSAAIGAQCVSHLSQPPELSRPMHTLPLAGVIAPRRLSDRWSASEKNSLYDRGASGYMVRKDGVVAIERLVTSYTRNDWGSTDRTYQNVQTLAQSQYGIRFIRQMVENRHGRQGLVDRNPTGNPALTTAMDVGNTIDHAYNELVALGVFENFPLFRQQRIVERNRQNPDRLDVYLPVDHVNQLRIVAVNVTNFPQFQSAA